MARTPVLLPHPTRKSTNDGGASIAATLPRRHLASPRPTSPPPRLAATPLHLHYTGLMATPQFILDLREHIGNAPLWVPGCTGVVVRNPGNLPGNSVPDPDDPDVDIPQNTPDEPEILIVRRADNGTWTPVTGIIDPGEEPAAAIVREVKEEADVVAAPIRLLSTEVVGPTRYANGDVATYLDVAFALEWVSGEPRPADGENTEAAFVPVSELPPMNARFEAVIARALSDDCAAWFRS